MDDLDPVELSRFYREAENRIRERRALEQTGSLFIEVAKGIAEKMKEKDKRPG